MSFQHVHYLLNYLHVNVFSQYVKVKNFCLIAEYNHVFEELTKLIFHRIKTGNFFANLCFPSQRNKHDLQEPEADNSDFQNSLRLSSHKQKGNLSREL